MLNASGSVGRRRYICDVIVRRAALGLHHKEGASSITAQYNSMWFISFQWQQGAIITVCPVCPLLWRGRHRMALSMLLGSAGYVAQVTMP